MILVDTSALAKLLLHEPESEAVRETLVNRSRDGDEVFISILAVTELHRLAVRIDAPAQAVDTIVRQFRLLAVTEEILGLAGRFPERHLGTLDAIHLATAVTAEASSVMTYDPRLAEASSSQGLTVMAPA